MSLPSPLLRQSFDTTRPLDLSGWDSLNPFAEEGRVSTAGKDGREISIVKPVMDFTIVPALEETRTFQACQACKARKSKCDGLLYCIRCKNKGIQCVYPTKSLRVKQGRRASSSSLPHSSCYTMEKLDRQSTSFKSSQNLSSEPGVSHSKRKTTVGSLERKRDGSEDETEMGLKEGRKRSRGGLQIIEVDHDAIGSSAEDTRRHTSPDLFQPVVVPFGSSLSTSSSLHYPQSYAPALHNLGYHQYLNSPPPPSTQQMQHQSLLAFPRPPPPHRPKPHFQPSNPQPYSPTVGYCPFTTPLNLSNQNHPPSFENQSLLFKEELDASVDFDQLPSPSAFQHVTNSPYPRPARQSIPDVGYFPSAWPSSSNSHLGLTAVLYKREAHDDASASIRRPSVQMCWGQGSWVNCGAEE